ncbi:MAG: VanZ family protein [Bacteroidota bacterium]
MMQAIRKLLGPNTLKYGGIVYTSIITFLLLFPFTHMPKVDMPSFDKIGHVLIFVLLVLIWLLFDLLRTTSGRLRGFRILIFAFIYGIVIEVLQGMFFVSRTADVWDVVANTTGILLGWIVFNRVKKVFIPKN